MIDAASAHHDHFSNFFESRGLLDGRNNTNFLVEACFIMSRITTQYGIVLQSNITARLNCKHEQLMQYLRRVNSCDGSAATSAQHYEWTNESFVPISAGRRLLLFHLLLLGGRQFGGIRISNGGNTAKRRNFLFAYYDKAELLRSFSLSQYHGKLARTGPDFVQYIMSS
jgi:hypothetical protein